MAPTDRGEIAKRLRAAMAYGGLQRDAAAKALGVSPSHLDRFTNETGKYQPSPEQLEQFADQVGLPAWFRADLGRLGDIATPEPNPRHDPDLREKVDELLALARAAERWRVEQEVAERERRAQQTPGRRRRGDSPDA